MSAFESPVSPSGEPQVGQTDQQVMSAQAPASVLEGEDSGPNYSQAEAATVDGGARDRTRDQLPNAVARDPIVLNRDASRQEQSVLETVPTAGAVRYAGSVNREDSEAGVRVMDGLSAHAHPPTFAIHTPPSTTPAAQTPQQLQQAQQRQHAQLQEPLEHGDRRATLFMPYYQSSRNRTSASMSAGDPGDGGLEGARDHPEGGFQGLFGGLRGPGPRELPSFQPVGEPPRLPEHLREPERQGMWSGLARAGQALRRRMAGSGSASQTPQPSPDRLPAPTGLMQPAVARAMYEWTSRASLLTPTPAQPYREPEQTSQTSSIPQEVILEEVRKQVTEAMKGKDGELRDLKTQNEELRVALRESLNMVKDLKNQEGGQGRAVPPRDQPEDRGREPRETGAGGGQAINERSQGPSEPKSAVELDGNLPLPDRRDERNKEREDLDSLRGLIDGSRGDGAKASGSSRPGQETVKEIKDETAEPLQLLVQGMRQLQQVFLGKSDNKDSELKGSIQLQPMPEAGPESAVEYADWLFETEQAIGGLSDRSALWFSACLSVARRAYREYVNASPIARLTLEVNIPPELQAEKWSRLERRTMTLLLGAMTKTMKDDVIPHRVATVPGLLYRMFVIYQPGGASERASILRHLEGTSPGDNVHDTIHALRRWRRYLQRAEEMGIATPDASILLRSVETIIAKTMENNGDLRFKLSLIKNELQIQSRPTVEGVIKYHSHALAELQQTAPTRNQRPASSTVAPPSTTEALRLKAVTTTTGGTGEATSPSSSASRKTNGKTPCKFFSSETGCKRGSSCKYDHTFETKEAKRSRCWECGASNHRRAECPVAQRSGKGPKSPKRDQGSEGGGGSSSSSTTAPSLAALAAAQPPIPVASQQALLESIQQLTGATAPTTTTTNDAAATVEPTRTQDVQALLQEANAMLSKLTKLAAIRIPDLRELTTEVERIETEDERRAALLDSGASHSFRAVLNPEEEQQALPVRVELAGGQFITLKQNRGGTLLAARDDPNASQAPAILPLGAMVQKLGCELQWTRHGGLRVYHPQFGELKTFVKGNHPMLGELQALEIISQLEDLKLRELEGNTLETAVRLMDKEESAFWEHSVAKYVQTGERAHALEALMFGSSPLGTLPLDQPALMAPTVNLDNKSGWKYLKALPIKRSTRRAMMEKRWSVRCFASENDADMTILNSNDVVFVDINVSRSKLFNLKGDSIAYRALMWAALRGQLEGMCGAVPTNQSEELKNKVMWLWIVAKKAASVFGVPAPYLAMSGTALQEFWKSDSWKGIQAEYEIPLVDLQASETNEVYLIATNLDLDKDPQKKISGGAGTSLERESRWPPSIYKEIMDGIQQWRNLPNGRAIKKMDAAFDQMKDLERQRWIRHVKNGHLPFERRCRTCIEACATGRAHRRVVAPSCYVLSLDLCGPFRVKADYGGAKGFRYALVGAYVMPKLKGGKDTPIPEYTPEKKRPLRMTTCWMSLVQKRNL